MYDEVDVVAHNAKVMDLETELPLCPLYSSEQEVPHGIAMEDHLLPVCPSGDMIGGIGLKKSSAPHIGYTEMDWQNALAL
jgi:hypothetical protein